MISKASYDLAWIKEAANKLGKRADPKLLEKVIHAFTLLEQLQLSGLDFVFKGGTCLLLTTYPARRFSIDIDIISDTTADKLPSLFDKIVKDGYFFKWVDDSARAHATDTPIGHFKFYYKSKVDSSPEEPILLDILYMKHLYPSVKKHPIKHDWLTTEGKEVEVNVPAIESILGDKLTAFAPKTTGILYSKGRPVEIVKQLYDIGFLCDLYTDLELVRASYHNVVAEEIGYRKLPIDKNAVLKDTREACLLLAIRDEKNQDFIQLQNGIKGITNFILGHFKIEEAIVAAAKTAYLTSLIETMAGGNPERYQEPGQVAAMEITNQDFNRLNKLKKTNPEAFFYWHKTLENLKQHTK
jgi:hypothetical protein